MSEPPTNAHPTPANLERAEPQPITTVLGRGDPGTISSELPSNGDDHSSQCLVLAKSIIDEFTSTLDLSLLDAAIPMLRDVVNCYRDEVCLSHAPIHEFVEALLIHFGISRHSEDLDEAVSFQRELVLMNELDVSSFPMPCLNTIIMISYFRWQSKN